MRSLLLICSLLMPTVASASSRVVMEGVRALRDTVFVDTTNARVAFATNTYVGGVPNVGIFTSSNIVISDRATGNSVVIYATGSITVNGVVLGAGGGAGETNTWGADGSTKTFNFVGIASGTFGVAPTKSTFTATGQLQLPSQPLSVMIGTNTYTTPMMSIRGAGTANNLIEFWKGTASGTPNSWVDGFGDPHFSIYLSQYLGDLTQASFASNSDQNTGIGFPTGNTNTFYLQTGGAPRWTITDSSSTIYENLQVLGTAYFQVGASTALWTPGYSVTIDTTGPSDTTAAVLVSTFNTTNLADEVVQWFSIPANALNKNGAGFMLEVTANNQTANNYKIRFTMCGFTTSLINFTTVGAAAYNVQMTAKRTGGTKLSYSSFGFDSQNDNPFVTNSAKNGALTCDFTVANNLVISFFGPVGQMGMGFSTLTYR